MPTAPESIEDHAGSQLASALAGGIDTISQGEVVTFRRYRRVVLPLDGFVFWVREDLYAPSARYNDAMINSMAFNARQLVLEPAPTLPVKPSSLHHTTLNQQDEAESFSLQQFTLTCQEPVDQLTAIAPDTLWIGDWKHLKLAFSSRTGFYRAANTYHYHGDALYPALATQVIDDPNQLNDADLIVSNSLPIWLRLATDFPLYPSYLAPDNVRPPYAVVHIGEDDTSPLQAAPWKDATGSRWQLMKDRVRVTTYGVRNADVLDWMDHVADYTVANTSIMGLMNSPAVRDAKRGQTEFSIIAQKKVITFEVSYYQARVKELVRQLIKTALIDIITQPFSVGNGTLQPVVIS